MNELKEILKEYDNIEIIKEENNIIYFKIEDFEYLEYIIYYRNEFLIIENRIIEENEYSILYMINIILYDEIDKYRYKRKIQYFIDEIIDLLN